MERAIKKRGSSDAAEAQLIFEKAAHDTWMAEGCLNKGMDFSIHTPNEKIEHLGLSPQNKKGGSIWIFFHASLVFTYISKFYHLCS